MTHPIIINQAIQWSETENSVDGRFERIIWFDELCVIVIDLNDNHAWPKLIIRDELDLAIAECEARVVNFTDERVLMPDEKLSDAVKNTRNRAYNVIKDIINPNTIPKVYLDIHYFRELAQKASQAHDCCDASIYKWVRKFLRGGMVPNALAPRLYLCGQPKETDQDGNPVPRKLNKKQGRPSNARNTGMEEGNVVITEEIKRKFAKGISLYWRGTKAKKRLSKAYDYVMERFFAIGYEKKHGTLEPKLPPLAELPTRDQFYYWYKQFRRKNYRKVCKHEAGERKFNLMLRELLGNSTDETFGPGSHYQIDATILDCYVVSRDRTKIIGRPVYYHIVDVFSRMIVGFYIGLEGPSWLGAMQAIYNATRNKVEWYAKYGIEIAEEEFPVEGVPEIIMADKGEMRGNKPENLLNVFNINVQNAGSWRPDLKGIVERYFKTIQGDAFEWSPERVISEYWVRGEKDYRHEALLTIEEITRIFMYAVLYHNNDHYLDYYPLDRKMLEEDVEPIPMRLWEWGSHKNGRLKEFDKDIIKLNLLPFGEAAVTEKGILFKGIMYGSDRALKENLFMQAREKGRIKIPISYDPRFPEHIYWRLNDGKGYEVCYMLEKSLKRFAGMSAEEIELRLYFKQLESKTIGRFKKLKGAASYQKAAAEIRKGAKEETRKAQAASGLTKRKLVEGMRHAREMEKSQRREEECYVLPDANKPNDTQTVNKKTNKFAEEDFSAIT